jgi:hypothetical protein
MKATPHATAVHLMLVGIAMIVFGVLSRSTRSTA